MPVDMNKTIAEASLDHLHDIMLPEPIGLFPLAPGWILLILLLLTLLFHFAWQYYLQYKKTQYKRDALEELQTLKGQNREHTLSLLTLAKRTAMAAYSRENIATLTDDSWWDFMQNESKTEVPVFLREEIQHFLYSDRALDDNAYHTLFSMVETWIKTHKGLPNV